MNPSDNQQPLEIIRFEQNGEEWIKMSKKDFSAFVTDVAMTALIIQENETAKEMEANGSN